MCDAFVGSFSTDHSIHEKMNYSLAAIKYANNKKKMKKIRQTKGKYVFYDENHTTYTYKIKKMRSFHRNTMNHNSQCHENTNIHKQNHVLFPQHAPLPAGDEVLVRMQSYNLCWSIIASMTGESIVDAESHHGMRVSTMKQSCAENFIAQKKKQNHLSTSIQ